jgi:hypothetical protein
MLLASFAAWVGGGRDRAERQRLGIFIGLLVPSFILAGAYLTRKADDLEFLDYPEDLPFEEELM